MYYIFENLIGMNCFCYFNIRAIKSVKFQANVLILRLFDICRDFPVIEQNQQSFLESLQHKNIFPLGVYIQDFESCLLKKIHL